MRHPTTQRIRPGEHTRGMFLAEPLYILLASQGSKDAHAIVKEATLRAEQEGRSVLDVVEQDVNFKAIVYHYVWKKLRQSPDRYIGKSAERSRDIASYWKGQLQKIRGDCRSYRTLSYD